MPWRELLYHSHSLAVLSAAGVALLAFPGADLAKSAQPQLARVVAPAPTPRAEDPALRKGPETRLTGSGADRADRDLKPTAAATITQAPARAQRAFAGCLYAHEQAACRRAFEAAIERQGGFVLAPTGERMGTRKIAMLPTLLFDETPQWRRRIEAWSEDGIAFKRLRRGKDHELVIGITRDGVLGFSLEEKPSGR
ncbi:MAG: hypothetical protein ACRETT_05175 [Steroidobacteraceae bacterium]